MTTREIIAEIEKLGLKERQEIAVSLRRLEEANVEEPLDASDEAVWDVLLKFAGQADGGMPEDMSINHDHYLYGTPKKQP